MAETKTRIKFPRLSSSAFEHPADRAALDALKKIPVLDKLFARLIELGYERIFRMRYLGSSVHVTPKQCPKIYNLYKEAIEILDVQEPDLFLTSQPFPNAMTIGVERPMIVLHSSLVDLLTEDELRAVLGHELGHVKAGHVLYKTIAYAIKEFLRSVLNMSSLANAGVMIAMYDWSRKAELTADRAWSVYEQMDEQEFLKQANSYEDMDYSAINKFYKILWELQHTHPLPVYRAREIKNWSEGKQYQEILEGRYPTTDQEVGLRECPHCETPVSPSFFFCPDCGGSIRV